MWHTITTFVLIGSLLSISQAQADVVERIVATVNDNAIFLSDLRKRATPFLGTIAEAKTNKERTARLKQLYEEGLTLLIDEKLLGQLAKKTNITVTQQDVEQFIQSIQTQNELTEQDFWKAIRDQGMSEAQYRKDLKRQILRFKIINEHVRNRINITEDEVQRRYEQQVRVQGSQLRFRVSHIVVLIDDIDSATHVDMARQDAQQLADSLTPDNFDEKAAQLRGGDMGWVSQGDLAPELQSVLLQANPNQMTPPTRAGNGFHIFLVKESKIGNDFPAYNEIHDQLMREMLDAALTRQERIFLDELRRKAIINRML